MKRQWNVICDVCGWKYKNWQLKKRWDGLMVCEEDWEPRQPLDMFRVPKDDQSVPWTRPEPTDTFVSVTYNAAGVTDPDDTTDYTGTFETNNGTL